MTMTKKQYQKKMKVVLEETNTFLKNRGLKGVQIHRISRPNFGGIIPVGKHKGEKLVSYAQCWDMVREMFYIN